MASSLCLQASGWRPHHHHLSSDLGLPQSLWVPAVTEASATGLFLCFDFYTFAGNLKITKVMLIQYGKEAHIQRGAFPSQQMESLSTPSQSDKSQLARD